MDNESGNDQLPQIGVMERDLRIHLLDYLFERGHKVSKPLIHAVAKFTYDYGKALYQQGKLAPTDSKETKDA